MSRAKMISCVVMDPITKKQSATMLPAGAILRNPKGIRADALMEALRVVTLEAHARMDRIDALLQGVAKDAATAAGKEEPTPPEDIQAHREARLGTGAPRKFAPMPTSSDNKPTDESKEV